MKLKWAILSTILLGQAADAATVTMQTPVTADHAIEPTLSCPNDLWTGGQNGVFRIVASGFGSGTIRIYFTLTGSAVRATEFNQDGPCPSADYGLSSGVFWDEQNGKHYININGSGTYPVVVVPWADRKNAVSPTVACSDSGVGFGEVDENIILTLNSNPSFPEAYAIGNPGAATIALQNQNSFKVILTSTSAATLQEGGADVSFTVARACGSPLNQECKFRIRATKVCPTPCAFTPNNNYLILGAGDPVGFNPPTSQTINGQTIFSAGSGSITIPANVATMNLVLRAINDTIAEDPEAFSLGTSCSSLSKPIQFSDNDLPTVTVSVTDANAAEQGNDQGTFTISRDNSTALTIHFGFSASATATLGSDYSSTPGTPVTIPPGVSSTVVTVLPQNDSLFEGPETVILQIQPRPEYNIGSFNTPIVTIADNDCYPAPPGLLCWFKGENDVWEEVSQYWYIDGPNLAYGAGVVGQCFEFNGIDSWVAMNPSAQTDLGIYDGFTIEAWVNPYNLNIRSPLVDWNSTCCGFGTHLWILPPGEQGLPEGNLYANIDPPSWAIITAPGGTMQANQFRHIALTFDNITHVARIYRNGELVAEQDLAPHGITNIPTEYDLFFGARANGDGQCYFSGKMDEISLYSRVLTPAEIQNIHNAGSYGKCVP